MSTSAAEHWAFHISHKKVWILLCACQIPLSNIPTPSCSPMHPSQWMWVRCLFSSSSYSTVFYSVLVVVMVYVMISLWLFVTHSHRQVQLGQLRFSISPKDHPHRPEKPGLQEPGIDPPTLGLVEDPLYHLSPRCFTRKVTFTHTFTNSLILDTFASHTQPI